MPTPKRPSMRGARLTRDSDCLHAMPVFLIHYDLLQKPDVEYPTLIPTRERPVSAAGRSSACYDRRKYSFKRLIVRCHARSADAL